MAGNRKNTHLAAVMMTVLLWLFGAACIVIPFTAYLSPVFFLAGAYYGWKIWHEAPAP